MTITMTKTAYRGHQVPSLRGIGQPAADDDLLDSIPVEAPGSDPTPAQANLMAKLIGELLELDRNAWQLAVDYTARMSGRWTPGREGNASRWIDRLLAKVKELRAARGPVALEDGVYLLDGTYFMVLHAVHGSGRQYAKRLILPEDPELDKVRSEYAGTAPLKLLRPEHMLTAEQASAFGHVYGQCVFCFRPLTDDRSKAVGYGETCAGHRGLPWG
jgi:hypothetical protein